MLGPWLSWDQPVLEISRMSAAPRPSHIPATALSDAELVRCKAQLLARIRVLVNQDAELRARLAEEESATSNTFVAGTEGGQATEADDEVAADRLSVLSFKSAASAPTVGGAPASLSVIDGDGDLVKGLADGRLAYDKLEEDKLSEELKKMTPEKREAYLKEQVAKRAKLQKELDQLLVERRDFVTKEKARLAEEGKGDGFDEKVSEIISKRRR